MANVRSLLIGLLLAPIVTSAAELHKIAVLDLRPEGADAITAGNLTTVIAVEVQALGVFQVITRDDLQNMVSFETQKELLGCSEGSCMTELGGALGVERILTGKLGQIGAVYILSLSIINIAKNGKVESRVTRQVAGKDLLVAEIKGAVAELTGKVLAELSGFVAPKVNQVGAEIRLDGKLFGVAPIAPVRIPAGSHELRVSKSGYIDWAKDVVVQSGTEPLAVDVVLVPSPEFIAQYEQSADRTRLWAWIGTGAAVVTGAGAGAFYGLAMGNSSENGRAVSAAQAARDSGDGVAYEREAAIATRTKSDGEFQRNLAVGLGSAAVLAAGGAVYAWATGDDPRQFRQK